MLSGYFSRTSLAVLFALSWITQLPGQQWSRFRGPNGSGVADSLNIAGEITDTATRWKVDMAAGTSSPIIVKGMMYISGFNDNQRMVICLDAVDGKQKWITTFPKLRDEVATAPNGPATCSLACDGRRIVAFFPDAGLVALSMDGQQQWLKDLGPFSSMHGLSASPILFEDKIILAVDQLSEPYLAAFDANTGDQVWRVVRLPGITGGYSTPAIMKLGDVDYLVSAGPGELAVYDPATGEKLAVVEGLCNAPIAAPVVVENRIYYNEPPGEAIPMSALGNADRNKDGAIELTEVDESIALTRLIQRIDNGFGNGDGRVDDAEWSKAFGTFLNRGGFACVEFSTEDAELKSKVLWKYAKSTPYIPSCLVAGDTAYLINDGGILMAFDSLSGEMLQRARLGDATGQYYASPVLAGELLVLASRDGKLTTVKTGRPFEVLHTYAFDDPIIATPVIDQGRLYVRTKQHLICIGNAE